MAAPDSEVTPRTNLPPGWPGFVPALRLGLKNGLLTTWELAKVMVPVYYLVTVLKYSPAMPLISRAVRPAMGIFGLPGDASVPLVAGLFTNFYAALGAVKAIGLTPREVTVLGLMLVIAHSLPMEWVVLTKLGARGGRITLLRCVTGIVAALLAYHFPLGQ